MSAVIVSRDAEWTKISWTKLVSKPPFDLGLATVLQEVPGIRLTHDGASGTLQIPRNAECLQNVQTLFAQVEESQIVLDAREVRFSHIDPEIFARKPYSYQLEAAELALREGRLLLADEMGLGKTTAAIVAAETKRRMTRPLRPVFIVGPKQLRRVWQTELVKLGLLDDEKDERWLALEGLSPDPRKLQRSRPLQYIFAHFEVLDAWWSLISVLRPCAVLLDEAHQAKNPQSKRGKAAALVTTSAPLRIVLTGTPVLNRLGELHAMLTLVTGPWTFGSLTDFRIRYAGAVAEGYGYVDTEPTFVEELRERLGGVFLQRSKKDVNLELPPLVRQMIPVTMSESDQAKYAEKLGGYSPRDVVRALIDRGSQKVLTWTGALRKIASRAKYRATVEHVENLLEQGGSVIVFCWEREMAERLAKALQEHANLYQGAAYAVHGEVSTTERDERMAAFQRTGGVVCATFGAIAVGVTLTRANAIVMHDMHDVPGIMLQAEARAWRIGQERSVTSYWMTAEGTSDEIIARIFEKKAAAIAVLGDSNPQSIADLLSKDEVTALWGSAEDFAAWAQQGNRWG